MLFGHIFAPGPGGSNRKKYTPVYTTYNIMIVRPPIIHISSSFCCYFSTLLPLSLFLLFSFSPFLLFSFSPFYPLLPSELLFVSLLYNCFILSSLLKGALGSIWSTGMPEEPQENQPDPVTNLAISHSLKVSMKALRLNSALKHLLPTS